MDEKLCRECLKRPMKKHFNAKYCAECASNLRRKPKSTLTEEQKEWVKVRIGKMPVSKMACELQTSVSNIKRAFRGTSLWFKNGKLKNNPELVREVLEYYSEHGKVETQKMFPHVRIKSILHREKYYGVEMKPRQTRWTEEQIVLAAKLAGLVDGKRQARIFNRPNANEGSIRSLWMKRFGYGGGNVHGLSEWMAREILEPGYPVVKTRVWSPRKGAKSKRGPVRGLVLWCDMKNYLRPGLPRFVEEAIFTLSDFQCWLFQTRDPKSEIIKLVSEAS